MLNLSSIVKVEKNKLTANSVFLCLLEINIPSLDETIRIVNNNEDISWNSFTWQKFPFEIDEISENSNGETFQFSIKVGNVNNVVGQYIRQYEYYIKVNGFKPITCALYIVNSKDLENNIPVFDTRLTLNSSSLNMTEVVFTVSARDLYRARTPQCNMYPNSCRFNFKDTRCKYKGNAISCDKTLLSCKQLENSQNYGAFPTIGNKGIAI